MDYEKIITWGLAIYGAVLSTILGVRELIKERRRLLIFLQYGEFGDNYSIIITNIGHRPITLLDISMEIPRERVPQSIITQFDDPFPVTLSDGQHIIIRLSPKLSNEIYQAKENIRIAVYDTENRTYSKLKKLSHNEKFGVHGPRRNMK
jgi:hypothetical protein